MRVFLSGVMLFVFVLAGCSDPPALVRLDDFENEGSAALVRHLMHHPLLADLPVQPEVFTILHGKLPETKSASKAFLNRFADTGKIMASKDEIAFFAHNKEIYHKRTKESPVTIQLVSVSPSDISHYRIQSGLAYKQNFIVESYDVVLTDDGPTVTRIDVLEQNWK